MTFTQLPFHHFSVLFQLNPFVFQFHLHQQLFFAAMRRNRSLSLLTMMLMKLFFNFAHKITKIVYSFLLPLSFPFFPLKTSRSIFKIIFSMKMIIHSVFNRIESLRKRSWRHSSILLSPTLIKNRFSLRFVPDFNVPHYNYSLINGISFSQSWRMKKENQIEFWVSFVISIIAVLTKI